LKNFIGIFLIFSIWAHALDRESTLKIYQDIFTTLSDKPVVSVYTLDSEYQNVFKKSSRLHLVHSAEGADIILITNIYDLNSVLKSKVFQRSTHRPIVFVTNYNLLKNSESIVGAIYWRKGRSQLLFLKEHLQKNHIKLPKKYHKFMVEKL